MCDEGNDEILALVSIYEDKLRIEEHQDRKQIGITIHPATADDSASQYVCLDMSLGISAKYPAEAPEIKFSKSRGLSDVSLNDLKKRMEEFLKEREGECVLFDLLEMAKDMLTYNNIPSCLCPICLSGFQEGDDFLKTDCYHYFHCYCLNEYKNNLSSETDENSELNDNTKKKQKQKNTKQKQKKVAVPPPSPTITVSCPVCRLPVLIDVKMLEQAKLPLDSHDYKPDKALLRMRKEKYEKIYEKQLQNGGLIDLEYEQNKYLLSNIQKVYKNQQESAEQENLNDGASKEIRSKIDQNENLPSTSTSTNHVVYGRSHGHKGAIGHGFKNYGRHHNRSWGRGSRTPDSCGSDGSYRGRGYFTKPKSKPNGYGSELNRCKTHATDYDVSEKDSKSTAKLNSDTYKTQSKERRPISEMAHADGHNVSTGAISVDKSHNSELSEGAGSDFKKEIPGHIKGRGNSFRGGRHPHGGRGGNNHFYRHEGTRSSSTPTEKRHTNNPHSYRTYRPNNRGRPNSAKYKPENSHNHQIHEKPNKPLTVTKTSEV